MAIEVRKKKGENVNSLIFRFNKRVKQSGVLKETKKRRFKSRDVNKNKKRSSALYRSKRQEEIARLKKYGAERKTKKRS